MRNDDSGKSSPSTTPWPWHWKTTEQDNEQDAAWDGFELARARRDVYFFAPPRRYFSRNQLLLESAFIIYFMFK